MKTLFVYDSSLNAEKARLPHSPGDEAYLFPLTSKVFITAGLKRKLEGAGFRARTLATAAAVNASADRIREKYVRFVSRLPGLVGKKRTGLKEIFAVDKYATLWWFSLISEKNTYKSDAFNRLAQLDSIIEAVKREKIKKIMFGCDSVKLRKALSKYSRGSSIGFWRLPIKKPNGLKRRFDGLPGAFYLRHLMQLVVFATGLFLKTKKVRKRLGPLRRVPKGKEELLVITYYPNLDIPSAEKGVFKNRYFPYLQEALEERGQAITWVAMSIFNRSISFEKSMDYAEDFIKNGYNIFFLEEFNSFRTQVWAFVRIFRSGLRFLSIEPALIGEHTFGDYNFYDIFRDDWYSSFAGVAGYHGLVCYDIFRALLRKSNAKKCLYYCEMQAWEKALVSARDSQRSGMFLLSYQHGALSTMLLNYFNVKREITDCPDYPVGGADRIVCDGPVPHKYLKESGWPEERLWIAEAIRYTHLKECMKSIRGDKKRIALLVFSISPEESSSILNLAYESFRGVKDIEIWIKPHPFLRVEDVFRLSGIKGDIAPFKVREEPVESLLSEARMAIVGESTVSIEALAFGCDVVIVNVPEWINMSPLKNVKTGLVRFASSPEELRQAADDIFLKAYDPETREREARGVINNYFYFNEKSDTPEMLLKSLEVTG